MTEEAAAAEEEEEEAPPPIAPEAPPAPSSASLNVASLAVVWDWSWKDWVGMSDLDGSGTVDGFELLHVLERRERAAPSPPGERVLPFRRRRIFSSF